MVPVIVAAGGVALTAAAFFGLKSTCKVCTSVFTLNQACLVCGEEVCGTCGCSVAALRHRDWPVTPAGRTCQKHRGRHEAKVAAWVRAIDDAESVRVFGKNYRGKIPRPWLNAPLESQFHDDRELAWRELRILAALEGARHVVHADLLREKRTEDNYIYSVWKAVGHI